MGSSSLTGFPDSLLADFEPQGVLGQGGMGTVFEARDRALDRPVAIKVMITPEDEAQAERFRREAAILASVRHPGVVQVYSFGESEEGPFLVMELLEGSNLDQTSGEPADVRALLDVAEALEEVHRAGVIHRDVKPANVFVTRDGRGLLVDFGLVKDSRRTRLTKTGHVVGTLAHLAPELLQGDALTPAADWYGWGSCLFTLLEGRTPRNIEEVLAFTTGREELSPPRFERLAGEAALRKLLEALLDPDPARRPTSAAGVRPALQEWLANATTGTRSAVHTLPSREPSGPSTAPERVGRRGFWLRAGLGAALLAAAGVWMTGALQVPGNDREVTAPPNGVAPRGGDSPVGFPPELATMIRDLRAGHWNPQHQVFLSSADLPHLDADRARLLDTRFPLRFRRLLKGILGWWSSLLPAEKANPDNLLRIQVNLSGLCGHLLEDLEILTRTPDERLPRTQMILDLEKASSIRQEMIRVVDEELPVEDFFRPDAPGELLQSLTVLAEHLPVDRTGHHYPLAHKWLLDARTSERSQIFFRVFHNLHRRQLRNRLVSAEDAWERVRTGLAALVNLHPPEGPPVSINVLIAGLNLFERTMAAFPGPQTWRHLPLVRRVLQMQVNRGERPDPAALYDAQRIRRFLIVRPDRRDRADALALGQDLWWWLARYESLWKEPVEVYLHFDGRGVERTRGEEFPRRLAAIRTALRDAGFTSGLLEAWGPLLRAARDRLEPGGAGLTNTELVELVDTLEDVLRRADEGGAPELDRLKGLLRGLLLRAHHPAHPYRADRLTLVAAFAREVGYPLGQRLVPEAPQVVDQVEGAARETMWRARNRIMAWEADLRLGETRPWPPSCSLARAFARLPQQEVTHESISAVLGVLDWNAVEKVRGALVCLAVCPEERCVDDPKELEGWVRALEQAPASRTRKQLKELCTKQLPVMEAISGETRPVPPEIPRLQRLCDQLGFEEPGR